MWLELRGEIEGLWWVPLIGLLGPAPIIALACATDPMWASLLSPLPLFLASLGASRSDKSGPAIALGALLGYLVPVIFGLSPLYPPCYRLMYRGIPVPRVESIPLPCRALPLPLAVLIMLTLGFIVVAPFALPIPIAWLVMCAYPTYVASRRFKLVPRLLLIAYAGALLASSALSILCLIFLHPSSLFDGEVFGFFPLLDLAASLLLASACLRKARRGGGRKLLSFLTFYALVGTYWLGWYALWWG